MRSSRFGQVLTLTLVGWASVAAVHADPGDAVADAVLGQADFAAGTANAGGGPTASSLNEPRGLTIDAVSGRLFVPDSMNNRVLSWPSAAAFTNGEAADMVFGQPDFTSNSINQGGANPTERTLSGPKSVATDSGGRLYVADSLNFRILRYDPPFSTNQAAVAVFGQGGSFTTATQASLVTPTADNLGNPDGIAIDASDRLYCADRFLSRVTIYSTPLASTSADLVIGQPNLTTAGANLTQTGLDHCSGVALDSAGNLYVGDEFNNRVLLFLAPLSNGQAAARVFGQPDFASNTANNGGIGAGTLKYSGSSATVAVDPVSGNLYVADALNNRVLEYPDPQTNSIAGRVFGQPDFVTATANTGGRSAATALDAEGNLYVSDRLNHRVLRYNVARADLAVSGVAEANPITLGDNLTVTITVTNGGPDGATDVALTSDLPAGAALVSATASQGSCSGTGPVTCALGAIASGANATVTLVVTPSQTGTASLSSTVAGAEIDPDTTNNAVTVSATVNAASSGGGGGGGGGGTSDMGGNDGSDDMGDILSPESCGACGAGIMPLFAAFAPLMLVKRGRSRIVR